MSSIVRPARYAVLLGAVLTAAACGASTASGGGSSGSGSSSGTGGAPAASAASTIGTRNVPGVGTVLVNGSGQTLYLLTSEQHGTITCTASNGCFAEWPEVSPAGGAAAKAGPGVTAALLGSVKVGGTTEVTYHGWPLYTFAGDSGPGTAKGQGITSFGGTWYVLNAAGNAVTGSGSGGSTPAPSSTGGGGNGY